jgi:uncharacterized protein (TIGR02145 family)
MGYDYAYSNRSDTYKSIGFSVRCIRDIPETGTVDSLDCFGIVQNNFLSENNPADNVQVIVPYFGGNGGIYNSRNILSTGVTGLNANITNGNFTTGNDNLKFLITGTPASFGAAVFNISIGGKQCSISLNVGDTGSVRDIDGNLYTSTKIGNQEWMQQNLKVGKYRNGDAIPNGLDSLNWSNTSSGAFDIYNNEAVNDSIYGKLYNWYAVADPRGLCPVGWHVPTDHDWNLLIKNLDADADTTCWSCSNSTIAGGIMKSIGTKQASTGLWQEPNASAENSIGFGAHPAGLRSPTNGLYENMGNYSIWWSSTNAAINNAWVLSLVYLDGTTSRGIGFNSNGLSVRCLRD